MTPKTSQMSVSSAQVCRDLGWNVGDRLADVDDPRTTIELTAIGVREVLARQIVDAGGLIESPTESLWSLTCRNWEKV